LFVLEPKVSTRGAGLGAPKGFDDVPDPAEVAFEPIVLPKPDVKGPVACPKGAGVICDPNGFELLLLDATNGEGLGAAVCWKGEGPIDMEFEDDVPPKGDGFDAVNGDGTDATVLIFVLGVFEKGDGCDVEGA
jgi:hypothetical protein